MLWVIDRRRLKPIYGQYRKKGIEIWKTLRVSAHFNASDVTITTAKPVAFLYKNVALQSGARHNYVRETPVSDWNIPNTILWRSDDHVTK